MLIWQWVLTTWTDEECKLIMKNCYNALPVGGKMIACEPVLPKESDNSLRTRALLEGDIFVMTIYRAKGKHRTEEEFRQLGLSAGFPHLQAFYIDYFYTVLEFQKWFPEVKFNTQGNGILTLGGPNLLLRLINHAYCASKHCSNCSKMGSFVVIYQFHYLSLN